MSSIGAFYLLVALVAIANGLLMVCLVPLLQRWLQTGDGASAEQQSSSSSSAASKYVALERRDGGGIDDEDGGGERRGLLSVQV